MENTFLAQGKLGKNNWWRYPLTILAIVAGIVIANLVVRQVLPTYKTFFPSNQFGEDLGTSLLIGVVFSVATLIFAFASKKIHNRTFLSFVNTDGKFNLLLYLKGFFIWGFLLFTSSLILDYDVFNSFLENVNIFHFIVLLLVGFITIGIQSFFEELVIRGYFLQGMHLRIKKMSVLIFINAIIFAVLHFGYGISSFIHSFTFGIAFALIVILQNRIEFAAGAHNANNLILSLVFLDIGEATNAAFSWDFNWTEMGIHLFVMTIFVSLVFKFFKK